MEGWAIVAVVGIVFGCGVEMVRAWSKGRKAAPELDAETQASLARVAKLEERVRTLEAIVTGQGYQVANEIDRLERSA